MKYFITALLIAATFTACKKTEDPHPQPSQKIDSVSTAERPVMEQTLNQSEKAKMKTAEGALNIIVNAPAGGPIPPHFLPAKDIKFVSKTDSTATYTFTGGTTGMKVKVVMKKFGEGGDITWNVGSIAPDSK